MRRLRVIRVYKNLKAGGGVQTRLLELLPRLAEHVNVRVLCYRGEGERAGELRERGVPVDVVPLGVKWSPGNVGRYVKYFRAQAPDVVHTHEYTANTLGVAAAARAEVPVRVRHLHSLVPWGWDGWLRTRLRQRQDRRAARLAHLTLAVSEAVRQHYLQALALAPESCRVLYNGIDVDRFRDARAQGAAFRAEVGVAPEAPVVGIVGRLSRGKGHREFLGAARRLADALPSARFLIVGDGGLRSELVALADELGLGQAVVFTGYRRDVPAALGAMDLFWCTSKAEEGGLIQEGLTGAALEAQAAGVPVVAFRLPMNEEVLEDGVTGTIVPEGDLEALARASLGYLSDAPRREDASRRGRERARRFSLEVCLEETLRLYDELLSRPRGAR